MVAPPHPTMLHVSILLLNRGSNRYPSFFLPFISIYFCLNQCLLQPRLEGQPTRVCNILLNYKSTTDRSSNDGGPVTSLETLPCCAVHSFKMQPMSYHWTTLVRAAVTYQSVHNIILSCFVVLSTYKCNLSLHFCQHQSSWANSADNC